LREDNTIEGLFVSDCGILFENSNNYNTINKSNTKRFNQILLAIQKINKRMCKAGFMLFSIIAYGEFQYHEKLEFPGIGKNPIYGNAYITAYCDVENGKPKMRSGECRIVKENFPSDIDLAASEFELLKAKKKKKHYYYYWALQNASQMDEFDRQYNNGYSKMFDHYLQVLKHFQRNE
jgi:hypothetical protein